MKSDCHEEQSDNKKGYVFFSDPDIIVKRAESSTLEARIRQNFEAEQQASQKQPLNSSIPGLRSIKSLENLTSFHPVQPYPFTFISAVKQKLALGDYPGTSTKAHEEDSHINSNLTSSVLKRNSKQNLCQFVQKMDFVKPLKVPDLRISPKVLDFSSRENTVSKEISLTKSEITPKEFLHDRSDKTVKSSERVQRKLDFFATDGPSIINSESIEPLKAPNVSIASNLSKKKEHLRDVSREKENISKRIKKDDSSGIKKDEFVQHQIKRNKSPRRLSRRDATNTSGAITKLRNDKLPFHVARDNDYLSTKSKTRNFATSTIKKHNDKKQKAFNAQSVELTRDNILESNDQIYNNKTLFLQSCKIPDKITRDNFNNVMISSSNSENKPKDYCHLKQADDLTHKCDSESRQLKQNNSIHKEQTKRGSDKSKTSNNKMESKIHNINSEISEDIVQAISETNSSRNRISVYPISCMQRSINKDSEIITESKQNTNSARSSKSPDNFIYTENSMQSTTVSSKKDEESHSQSITTKRTTDDSNELDVSALPEVLFDPRRISFRDSSYSRQEEFPNLVTPEKMNLIVKSKRRKHLIQNNDSESDNGYSRYKSTTKSEKEQEKIQLMHPTALHMQFQAELHLLDSFNESLRQVMDVEKCLCSTKYEQEQKNPKKENENAKEVQIVESHTADRIDNDTDINNEKTWRSLDYVEEAVAETWKPNECNETHLDQEHCISNQANINESSNNIGKFNKGVKVAEVQTQTVNDIATQTDKHTNQWNAQSRFSGDRNIYERTFSEENEIPQLSLNSAEQFEDLDQIEEISLPSKIRTMSEISLHETTSSIKTETGTEISISTRGVKCIFNDYLDFEIAQLIKDENLRHDTIGMWFKNHEKTLHARTMRLVELEEQKRALGDKRDSRSLKKKQRALLLKFQQEKEEINKLKQLHEIASQERKLMFQKQRNMFNPQISTKNILTKLKRSADSQSPRRLSGPMKGYDIRSNSSMSSLVDSDKSQHDRSQVDTRLQAIESDIHFSKLDLFKSDKSVNLAEESNTSATKFADLTENNQLQDTCSKIQRISKRELNSRKYEEKMPKTDILRLKSHQLGSKLIQSHPLNIKRLLENQKSVEISQSLKPELNTSVPDFVKSESDALVELSKRSRTSQVVDPYPQDVVISKEKELASNVITVNNETIEEQIGSTVQDAISKTMKSSQVPEDILQTNINKNFKKIDKPVAGIKDVTKTGQYNTEIKASSKRKNSKYQKERTSNTLIEDILRSKSNSYVSKELVEYHDKQTKIEDEPLQLTNNESSILGEIDLNESQNSLHALIRHSRAVKDKNSKLLKEVISDYESKENVSSQALSKKFENGQNLFRNEQDVRNISTSQINAFAVSYHSSGESEQNCSRSIVVRSGDRGLKASKNFEQILTAREAALASRKNCLEEWMAWHAKLRTEEDRVTRMEQAALKLVTATSNVLFQQDTTVSSDTSDVEGRIELLTERLAERRVEMSRLKREAKRQAKQRLRALEANLLNQIKTYDTTIHEMRKKLESKKTIKDNTKLAIEAKSLADFKVPEIPLKIIQDIYKNSDLLRSKSESDLLLVRNQQKNSLKTVNSVINNDKYENKSITETIKSADVINDTVLETTTDANSIQSSFDECTSTKAYDKLQTDTSVLAISNDLSAKYTVSALDTSEKLFNETIMSKMKQNSASPNLGNVQTNTDSVRSELENIETVDSKSANVNIDKSQSEFSTIQSEIQQQENADCSETIPSKSDIDSNNDMLTISKKLNFLQLNNKSLNDDISSLENELKTLSEMMSRFSKKSNEISEIDHDEKSTPQEISEIISKFVFSDEIVEIVNKKTEEKENASLEKEISIEPLSIPKNDKKSKSCNDSSDEMQEIITEEVPTLSNSSHEIDYEAKSKEIMNEIEKSIISEHKICDDHNTVSALEIGIQNLHKDNEELLNDLISLEFDIKSVSEILSKASESRKNHDFTMNSATQITSDFKEDITERDNLNEKILIEDAKDQLLHSPIIAGHRLTKSYVADSKDNLESMPSTIPNTISHTLTSENLKLSEISEVSQDKICAIDNIKITDNFKCNEDVEGATLDTTVNTYQSQTISTGNISVDKDWTTSDSFEIAQNKIDMQEKDADFKDSRSCMNETWKNISDAENASDINNIQIEKDEIKLASDIEDVSMLVPKEESANINITLHKTTDSYNIKTNDELDDILDIIAREDKQKKDISDNENKISHKIIFDFLTDLLDQVESIVENREKNVDNDFRISYDNEVDISADNLNETIPNISLLNKPQEEIDVKNVNTIKICTKNIYNNNNKFSNNEKDVIDTCLQTVEEIDNKSVTNRNVQIEINNEESLHEATSEIQELIITELDSDEIEDHVLPELQMDAKVELADEEEFSTNDINTIDDVPIKIQECLEPILEQDSSDGEQLDNLVEIAESELETVEKFIIPSQFSDVSKDNIISIEPKKAEDNINQKKKNDDIARSSSTSDNINKTFDILKDPDCEDISEESLEISEILDKNDFPKAGSAKKSFNVSQKYEAVQKSEEVIKIFDEDSQKSLTDSISNSRTNEKNTQSAPSVTDISELLGVEIYTEDDISANKNNIVKNKIEEQFHKVKESRNHPVKETVLQEKLSMETISDMDSAEEKSSGISLRLDNELHDADDKNSHMLYELHERALQLHEQDDSIESGEGGDTPKGVSEIEMDSPRDFNDSKLDVDILDDDLLNSGKATIQNVDVKTNFHPTSIVATSDKDIEAMIDKLKASLEQPGLEVADLEAKLLRIEQLQIELEIKKLEAELPKLEEASYYVPEIPNKPPPPYTPPGDGRLSTSLGSPSLLIDVNPSNVEELTAFTEKATALIYDAKSSGENIADLETPSEIYELNKEKDETVGKDRRIYNTFLFDLCKETIADVYRVEYEKPGPSWTKPNVKTKPMMKIPKNVEELTEYVSKEVATLFGFKTKLQRENALMRWSRKRRDRVDELLAREAQAEEDIWTKFDYDELAVKNGLTVAILDTLIMETVNVMKIAYGKKRKLMIQRF